MAEAIIALRQLSKHYGDKKAVDRLDLEIARGEIFGLLGPNGAGKTTTILMMLGLTEPTAGSALVCGSDATRHPLEVKRRVGYMPDDIGFYEDRSGLDNLIFTARLNGVSPRDAADRAEALLRRVGLEEAADQRVGTYSRGMRQRLGLADVLIKRPQVVILDEPTLGIDPQGVRELLALISDLSRKEGLTVLLCSHHLHQVQQICDRVGLFVRGRLIACGTIEALAEQLNASGTAQIELRLAGWPPDIGARLQALQGVTAVRRLPEESEQASGATDAETGGVHVEHGQGQELRLLVECAAPGLAPAIAAEVHASGTALLELRRVAYGLDDIYRTYFEGEDGP
ncbi:ABC transporter ATP-binding protein [Paenibacillus sp. IB182496]|uniref:ABC transporter ATP-binding protein n=1 Tax=Paenibacillus sabuli TaxID=2772509 RepID=A0A927BUZ1_9BACL|nr:ABC transporter ATP-binding protein [Paenibacillus sabuli]MBD2847318.1 ABC transporter ATP-binding protein [Paenibacillus sabuli]